MGVKSVGTFPVSSFNNFKEAVQARKIKRSLIDLMLHKHLPVTESFKTA